MLPCYNFAALFKINISTLMLKPSTFSNLFNRTYQSSDVKTFNSSYFLKIHILFYVQYVGILRK